MTDEEWEQQQMRGIMAAFNSGRPVFGDTTGVLRFADGDKEDVPDIIIVGEPAGTDVPRASWWSRLRKWLTS